MLRSWLPGVGSNHTSRLLSRTPSFRFGRALTDAFDETDDDDDANDEDDDDHDHDDHDDDNNDDDGQCDDYGFGSSR